jgi:sigma-B regulation protein RsbU (phosphoserine phosphatase)
VSNPARVIWTCVVALAVFVIWVAVGVSAQVGIGFFYAIAIGMASWWFGWRGGAVAIAACLALYLVGTAIRPVSHFGFALGVRAAVFVAVAALISLIRERLIALEHSAEELEAIRAALTPPSLPELAGVDVAAAFVPSELGVSGDFYLLTNGPDGSTVAIVGDVVGHGPKAAQLATFIRAKFAALAANTSDPAELLTLANQALLDRPGRDKDLVTAACLRFRSDEATLSWAIAGHPLPLHLPTLRELEPTGATLMLGVEPNLTLANADLRLEREEGVVVYTDGTTDVRQDGALLGREGLARFLTPLAELRAEALVTQIQKAVLDWTDEPVRDDLCVLVLRPEVAEP